MRERKHEPLAVMTTARGFFNAICNDRSRNDIPTQFYLGFITLLCMSMSAALTHDGGLKRTRKSVFVAWRFYEPVAERDTGS